MTNKQPERDFRKERIAFLEDSSIVIGDIDDAEAMAKWDDDVLAEIDRLRAENQAIRSKLDPNDEANRVALHKTLVESGLSDYEARETIWSTKACSNCKWHSPEDVRCMNCHEGNNLWEPKPSEQADTKEPEPDPIREVWCKYSQIEGGYGEWDMVETLDPDDMREMWSAIRAYAHQHGWDAEAGKADKKKEG